MSLRYRNNVKIIISRLEKAHNPKISKIRDLFFKKEYKFFRDHIHNKRVLIAGSGLGHDSFELARYNKEIVGIDILNYLLKVAISRSKKLNLHNVLFEKGDFNRLKYKNKSFDASILNMGTISDFDNKSKIIKELLRISKILYLDFYPPSYNNLKTRKKMYKEEGWKDVRIIEDKIVSKDGLESNSISKEHLTKIIKSLGAVVKYHKLCSFSVMAEIKE